MTGVDISDDLATLRYAVSFAWDNGLGHDSKQQMDEALARVEAELSRLRVKADAYDAARAVVKTEGNTRAFYVLRAEAAEARCARLQQALFPLQSRIRSFVYSQMGSVSEERVRPVIDALDEIAALAGPGSEQSSLPDMPADREGR